MDQLELQIESLIFAAEQPIAKKDIKYSIENALDAKIDGQAVDDALERIIAKYQSEEYAIEIVKIANGYQFLTKGAFHHIVGAYLKQINRRKLSRVALETLSIIAYKQPAAKSELERIRGVNCDYALQKLLDKELIEIVGRGDGPGKPLLYATSEKFMNYFGLKDLDDLPKLKEFQPVQNTIGEVAPIEEMVGEGPPETVIEEE